jgi:hypothetical protein
MRFSQLKYIRLCFKFGILQTDSKSRFVISWGQRTVYF